MESVALTASLAYPAANVRAPSATEPDARAQAFVREHRPTLEAIALRLCGHRADANDLVQDTFERALRAASAGAGHPNPRSWLVTILNNLFVDRCRRQARERRVETPLEQLDEVHHQPVAEAAPAWASVTVEQLKGALEEVREEFRVAYRMHALEGRSYKEIAQALQIPSATVGTRIARARRRLRELLVPTTVEAPQ